MGKWREREGGSRRGGGDWWDDGMTEADNIPLGNKRYLVRSAAISLQ
jgi:hypothetical protein